MKDQKRFLMREIIDLAIEKKDDESTIESLSEMTFCLTRIFEQSDDQKQWQQLFDTLDRGQGDEAIDIDRLQQLKRAL